jgi:hypothetical protein
LAAFGSKAHHTLGAEGRVDDKAVGADVESLVRVLRDEVCSGAIELNQSMVELVAGDCFGG